MRHVALLLVVAWICYAPGLSGGFHLDDFSNLAVLEFTPPGPGLQETLSAGLAQVSGAARVLPQLTFVAQADAWPTDPGAFLVVNLALHLANGLLVFLLARQLGVLAGLVHPGRIALFAAAIWLLSPIQISGVLYIVQRINQMASFFVFAGALAYLHGRARMEGGGIRPWVWMALGVFGGGGLAVLCKENGALLPLLLIVVEATLLPRPRVSGAQRVGHASLLGLPVLLLIAGLLSQHASIMAGYALRDFSWTERLLTQPGILLDYARKILLPTGEGLGLFHDDYPVVRWPPDGFAWGTILAFAALVGAAVAFRRRWPLPAFGLLWFVAGHAMEASWIPLELYFEHRNQVPLFGLAFALAALTVQAHDRLEKRSRSLLLLLAGAWMLTAAFVTHGLTTLWGKPELLIRVWHAENPESPRAITRMADALARQGDLSGAAWLYQTLAEEGPRPFHEIYGQWLRLGCLGSVPLPGIERVAAAYRVIRLSNAPPNGLVHIADWMQAGHCRLLAPLDLLVLVRALQANPAYARKGHDLQVLAGRFFELAGRHEDALVEIGAAYRQTGNPALGFIELRLLNALERRDELEQRLDALERHIHAGGVPYARYRHDVAAWRDRLAKPR